MSIKLKDIFIGNTNGDDEATKKNFSDLYFDGNNNYDQILNDDLKFIISGQKGTGKTILARYIELNNNNSTSTTKVLTKNIFTFQKLIEIGPSQLSEDELPHFFSWVMLNQISNCILSKKIKFNDISERKLITKVTSYIKYKIYYRKLKKFTIERYPKGNYQAKTMTIEDSLSSELGIETAINKFKSLVKASRNSKKQLELKNYYSVLSELENLVFPLLHFIDIIILFDDLDELELKLDNNNSDVSMLIKLIFSIKNINSKIRKSNFKKSKCILLLRSDILSQLNKFSSNLNKSLNDCEVTLYWIDKYYTNPCEHKLMQMILNKIKVSCSEISNLSDNELYNLIFPQTVDNKDVVRYLIDYSFGRPRDIIRYLNIIIQAYGNDSKFTSQMFANCKKDYSDSFCDELFNELYIHSSHNYIEDLLSLLKDLHLKSFNFNKIEKFYNLKKGNYPNITNIRTALNDLYRFGIIGNIWTRSDKPLYSWAYRKDGNKQIDFEKRFTVHYGFRKHLFLE